jgi:hypothetical protein
MFTAVGPILPAPVSGGSGSGLMTVMEVARDRAAPQLALVRARDWRSHMAGSW